MDIREKLIDVISDFFHPARAFTSEQLADHLIANGVTIQEWISVKDRLPQENE